MQSKRGRKFFSLLLKPNVHSVWLAKGGRKGSKAARIQLIIDSTRHGITLTSIELDSASIFQTCRIGKTHKNGCNFFKKKVVKYNSFTKGKPESH